MNSMQIPLGTPAPAFSLPGIDESQHDLYRYRDKEVLVIIFMCNHCPYVKGVISRLIDLQDKYAQKGVKFLGINSNDSSNYEEDSFKKMKEYASKWGMNFPYLRDRSQDVAKVFNAKCTPDIFVYNKDRELVYHGRIDDNWKDENKVVEYDLKQAIDELLERGEVLSKQDQQIPSMGCSIKWK